MNKTPIIIAIIAILVLCCCSTCAVMGTLYFLSKADDLPPRRDFISDDAANEQKQGYTDKHADVRAYIQGESHEAYTGNNEGIHETHKSHKSHKSHETHKSHKTHKANDKDAHTTAIKTSAEAPTRAA
jgi:hypothetical protein